MVLLFYYGIHNDYETMSEENREAVVTLSTPNARECS
jgi:hypothetical protein